MGNGQNQPSEYEARQFNTPIYVGKRALDFSPFQAALATFTPERAAAIANVLGKATISDAQRQFEAGELTAETLTLYYLYRIQQFDADKLNSVLELNPDALTIARRLDKERARGQVRGAMHGIPVLLKDNIATHDRMHNTAGAAALVDAQAARDAFITVRLREAGAVILGKAAMSEWAYYMTTTGTSGFSALGGQVKNPYGAFDVSGSSSGSAVAAAAHLAMVTVGTETTGSIIAPASQNSIAALKPSVGLVSRDQIIPISPAMDTAGPMGRTVTDVAILMNTLTARDPNDPASASAAALFGTDFTAYLNPDGLRGRRVGLLRFVEDEPWDEALYAQAIELLKAGGAEVLEIGSIAKEDFALVDTRSVVFPYDFRHGLDAYLKANPQGAPESLAAVIAFNETDPANRVPFGMDLLTGAQANTSTQAERDEALAKAQSAARGYIQDKLAAHNLDFLVSFNNYLAAFYAPPGLPALGVPGLYRENGEPVGITFVGDYGTDAQLIAAGYALEQVLSGRREPVIG
ncbi:MAG: amidase [Anaerolineae bacterium]|nr:amidase [Anaerolineae bacterium]